MNKPSNLNDSQWQAVTHSQGHLLIVAGPGTGKTHTLTHRIAHIAQQLNNNEKILAVTFTNKAADEMYERLNQQFGRNNENIFVGTFHKFCLKLLRKYIDRTDLSEDFQVDEEGDGDSVLSFDELLQKAIALLETHDDICHEIKTSYRYVFVDEYQDINEDQHALLKLLIQDGVNITAIGDPHQAIYGFRGSDVKFFDQFEQDFEGAMTLFLNDNYRSGQNILKACGQVIAKGSNFSVSPLTANIIREGKLVIHSTATDKAEAEYVVHQIEKMIGGTSMFSQDSGRVNTEEEGEYSFGDVAVLYRLNAQKKVLEEALHRSGIPYQASNDDCPDALESNVEKVNLLTIHAAKGLEFSVVFVIGCEENMLPLAIANFETDPEEERRLFYVAMTRAKEKLYLVSAKKRMLFGRYLKNSPSPFLSDIEEQLKAYEQLTAKTKKKKSTEKQLSLFK